MPYLINCNLGSCFYQVLQQNQATSMANYWMVSIDAEESISIQSTLQLLYSKQVQQHPIEICLAKCSESSHSNLEVN